jgi:hypothetical protein
MIPTPFIYTSLITIVVALITAILGPIIVLWVKDKVIDKSKTPTPMTEAINLNSLVDNQVEIILEELECDRIWIAQFHNGGNFYPTGKSIQKFSIFYEKLSLNTQSLQSQLQNIPASLFSKALSQLHKDGELLIPDIEGGNEMYGLESISSQISTKSLYMVGLYSLDNHLIGIMCIAYNNKSHKLTKDEWIHIRQKVGVIGTLLTEYLYANPIKK